jgi:uncharacterized protein (TIGR03085 family)
LAGARATREVGLVSLADEIDAERDALADTFARVGAAAPTLCGDWTALDLAAHVTSLERQAGVATFVARSLVARGVRLNDRAAGLSERFVRRERRRGFETLISRLRQRSPRLLLRPSVVPVGLFEIWMHHDDVTAANQLGHEDQPGLADSLTWLVRYQSRSISTTAVRLVDASGREWALGHPAEDGVVVQGPVGDLVRWCAGRPVPATLSITGSDDARAQLAAFRPRV